MKIYTKTGDDGTTGLFGGPRVFKNDLRIEAYGTIDELNASLGAVRAAASPAEIDTVLGEIQHDLFAIGSELATPEAEAKGMCLLTESRISALERAIDLWDERLPPLREFILPGGTAIAAELHVARGICRRAERHMVTLAQSNESAVSSRVMIYVNRLSDLLFTLARAANHCAGRADIPWRKPS